MMKLFIKRYTARNRYVSLVQHTINEMKLGSNPSDIPTFPKDEHGRDWRPLDMYDPTVYLGELRSRLKDQVSTVREADERSSDSSFESHSIVSKNVAQEDRFQRIADAQRDPLELSTPFNRAILRKDAGVVMKEMAQGLAGGTWKARVHSSKLEYARYQKAAAAIYMNMRVPLLMQGLVLDGCEEKITFKFPVLEDGKFHVQFERSLNMVPQDKGKDVNRLKEESPVLELNGPFLMFQTALCSFSKVRVMIVSSGTTNAPVLKFQSILGDQLGFLVDSYSLVGSSEILHECSFHPKEFVGTGSDAEGILSFTRNFTRNVVSQ